MMIKAAFFDWVNTLVHMEPDRHTVSAEVCREFGIDVDARDLLRGIYAAEEQMAGGRPLRWSADSDPEVHLRYNNVVLAAAGVTPPDKHTSMAMLQRLAGRFKQYSFAVFDDVRPVLTELRQRGMVTGLISNMPHEMKPLLERLGIAELLDFAVTPIDVNGENKPAAPIFLEALRRAGVQPGEAVHVGDEHFSDGRGAKAVGITPVIIDRYDLFPSLAGYRRLTSLGELPGVLDSLA
jgi:putative hydrolase of the HAD superfamily